MIDDRSKVPAALLDRVREIGRNAILAGCTLDEILVAVNIEARKYGYEWRERGSRA